MNLKICQLLAPLFNAMNTSKSPYFHIALKTRNCGLKLRFVSYRKNWSTSFFICKKKMHKNFRLTKNNNGK